MEVDVVSWWSVWGPSIIRAAVIVVLGIIVGIIMRVVTNRIAKRAAEKEDRKAMQRSQTLTVFLNSIVKVVLIGLVIVLILGEFGVEIGPIIAAAGVAGIAIGFGAQTLVQDFFGGMFMLTEGYVRVGDVVDVNGKAGLVEDISLRLLVLRDFGGNVHVIPNGEIRSITNMTFKFSRALIDVGVAYREDNDKVVKIMEEVGNEIAEEMKDVITAGPEIFGIDGFGDSSINWRVRFETKPIQQWNVARAYRRRLKQRFDEESIEIPFPHRTIYMGENHNGTAPFLHTKVYQPEGQEPEAHIKLQAGPNGPKGGSNEITASGGHSGADVA